MTIEEIKPIGAKKERFYIVLSSGEKIVLHGMTLIKTKLKVGDKIDKETLEDYQFEYEKITAFDKVIDLLGKGLKTKKQIRDYLKTKGYMPRVVEYVLEKLNEYKYVDDKNYADTYTKFASTKKGKIAIAFELRQKGVCESDIDQALSKIDDQKDVVLSIAQKYIKGKLVDQKTKEKLYRYLLGKGFSHQDCFYAINKCIQTQEEFD